MALLWLCGGQSPDFPLGLPSHHPISERERCFILPDGDKSLPLSILRDHADGEMEAPITAGQGLKSRLLTWPLLAWVGMEHARARVCVCVCVSYGVWM